MKELLDLMEEKGYSIRKLAEDARVSVSTIQNILRGHKPETPDRPLDIRPTTMRYIAGVLEVEIMEVKEFAEAIERRRGKESGLVLAAS